MRAEIHGKVVLLPPQNQVLDIVELSSKNISSALIISHRIM